MGRAQQKLTAAATANFSAAVGDRRGSTAAASKQSERERLEALLDFYGRQRFREHPWQQDGFDINLQQGHKGAKLTLKRSLNSDVDFTELQDGDSLRDELTFSFTPEDLLLLKCEQSTRTGPHSSVGNQLSFIFDTDALQNSILEYLRGRKPTKKLWSKSREELAALAYDENRELRYSTYKATTTVAPDGDGMFTWTLRSPGCIVMNYRLSEQSLMALCGFLNSRGIEPRNRVQR